jgi:hypothetical protein
MDNPRAVINGPDGGIIARYHETPDKDHDFEIRLAAEEEDRIHEINFTRKLSASKVENDVQEFFESVKDSYATEDWTVDMR